jgi:glycerol-3-phosphate acyltransferase PlsY
MITVIIFIVIAYFFGSLSSAIIVCKLLNLPDPRIEGSGNPGTANVLRIGGKKAAALVLFGDILKGFIPIIVARIFNVEGIALGFVALAAVIGHIYPIFFRFKGGKGVATFLGTTFALSPLTGVAFIITWLIVASLFRYASLASLTSSTLSIIYILIFSKFAYLIPLLAIIALIIWKHTANIQRLLAGIESKISLKTKA